LFYDLEKTGFDTIVSIEPSPAHYDIEELSSRFPFVSFVLPQQTISLGEQINLAVSELDTALFIVLWNDLKIIAGGTSRRMAERLVCPDDGDRENGEKNQFRRLCTVPVIQTSRFDTLPTLRIPELRRNKILTMPLYPASEGIQTLYPFDGVGIYDRDRFIRLGGFDGTLKSSYWQLMDFGFRAYLWGEEISSTQTLKLSYDSAAPSENNTINNDYNRFYLKNLAPVFRGDCASLPLLRFPGFLLRSSEDIFAAWEDFTESRHWVNTNSFRWYCNPKDLVNRWDFNTAEDNFIPEEEH
jgi:hypothetical protein